MLEAVDLACERGERRLFSGLNFALQAGELVYVHGANGCGKTTLLRTLCGLARLLLGDSVLWILDEPFNALDVKSVGRVQTLLGGHLDRGGMVVLTTHQEVEITSRRARHVHLGE